MAEVNLLRRYPRAKRNIARRRQAQAASREIAMRYGFEYFDGAREQGYGGYHYDGRWVPVAKDIVAHFGLRAGDRVLDVGCAKGFLVKDLIDVCPGLEAYGLDISGYALRNCHPDARGRLVRGTADRLPFRDGFFRAALCINVVHNFERERCMRAIREIDRIAPGRGYIQVDSYRDEAEREVFRDWTLTALTYGPPDFWRALFAEAGYTGDYYWTIIEVDPAWTILDEVADPQRQGDA